MINLSNNSLVEREITTLESIVSLLEKKSSILEKFRDTEDDNIDSIDKGIEYWKTQAELKSKRDFLNQYKSTNDLFKDQYDKLAKAIESDHGHSIVRKFHSYLKNIDHPDTKKMIKHKLSVINDPTQDRETQLDAFQYLEQNVNNIGG